MFAVPGWSVSNSELKQQTEQASSKQASKSQKRKRENENVTNGNVDEMYQRIIESKDGKSRTDKSGAAKSAKADKKKIKEGKSKAGNAADSEMENSDRVAGNGSLEGEDIIKSKGNKKLKKNKEKKTKKTEEQEQEKGQQKDQENAESASTEVYSSTKPTPSPPEPLALTPLQQAMRQKLISARFRHLNETLYTTDSNKAMDLFGSSPELFDQYHAGFSQQVQDWPSNPVDGYIHSIQTRGKVSPAPRKSNNGNRPQTRPLPRRPNNMCTIADLGCGDARLARTLIPSAKQLNLKLLSYDLQAPDSLITKADVSNLPTPDGTVDVAIFCLSLMGTNWVAFVEEAWRVLRGDGKGECWVSEVKSRFGRVTRKKGQIGAKKALSNTQKKKFNKKKKRGDDDDAGGSDDDAEIYAEDARPSDGGDETDISAFVDVFRSRGFILRPESVDKSNKMFVRMEFVKQSGPPTKGKYASVAGIGGGLGKKRFVEKSADIGYDLSPEEEAQVLKPCVYKTR